MKITLSADLTQYDVEDLLDQDIKTIHEEEHMSMELMVEGVASNRKLAKRLGVSENTVKFHVRNILDKLRLHSRAEAVGYALRKKIVDPAGGGS